MPMTKTIDLTELVRNELAYLQDPNPVVRAEHWRAIANRLRETRNAIIGPFPEPLADKLFNIYDNEANEKVERAATRMMVRFTFLMRLERPPYTSRGLGDWLWERFHSPSWVMRVSDPKRLRRDEEATISIARSLPYDEFDAARFVCIDDEGYAPPLSQLDGVRALCFVGRLCLFGEQAVKDWDDRTGLSQYRFGMDFRPSDLARGQLHDEYHSIVRSSDGKVWRTSEAHGVRKDFCMIRRYVATRGGEEIVVVHIAGCSSLGTQGGARFAAHTLVYPNAADKTLPVPDGIDGRSHFEALIQVTARIAGNELGWEIADTKLIDLRVDDSVWDSTRWEWKKQGVKTITVVFPSKSAKRSYRQQYDKVKFLVDGKAANLEEDSFNRRLSLALLMAASKSDDRIVSLEQLSKEDWIWNGGTPQLRNGNRQKGRPGTRNDKSKSPDKKVQYLKSRINNPALKKWFGDSFEIEGDTCRVLPDIHIEPESKGPKPR